MPEVTINYLAVLGAGVASFILGALWYSPVLFANAWMAALGTTEEEIKASGQNMPLTFGLTFVAWLTTSYVLSHIVDYAAATTLMAGMQTGFWLWLGFQATYEVIHGLFEGRDFRLYVINTGYHLVAMVMMGGILAVWV